MCVCAENSARGLEEVSLRVYDGYPLCRVFHTFAFSWYLIIFFFFFFTSHHIITHTVDWIFDFSRLSKHSRILLNRRTFYSQLCCRLTVFFFYQIHFIFWSIFRHEFTSTDESFESQGVQIAVLCVVLENFQIFFFFFSLYLCFLVENGYIRWK